MTLFEQIKRNWPLHPITSYKEMCGLITARSLWVQLHPSSNHDIKCWPREERDYYYDLGDLLTAYIPNGETCLLQKYVAVRLGSIKVFTVTSGDPYRCYAKHHKGEPPPLAIYPLEFFEDLRPHLLPRKEEDE